MITNSTSFAVSKTQESQDMREKHQWNEDWDELLVKIVSEKPAMHNYSLPVKDRSPLKIAALWQEISNSLSTFNGINNHLQE